MIIDDARHYVIKNQQSIIAHHPGIIMGSRYTSKTRMLMASVETETEKLQRLSVYTNAFESAPAQQWLITNTKVINSISKHF